LDSFIGPVSNHYNIPGGEEGIIPDAPLPDGADGIIPDAPPLSQHSALTLKFGSKVQYTNVSEGCSQGNANAPCGVGGHVDYGYTTASIILENDVSGQVLFYQIILYDTRQDLGCGFNPCQANTLWFDKGTSQSSAMGGSTWYGVSHSIANYGKPCLKPMGPAGNYSLNVLPKLNQVIDSAASSGAAGLDSNKSNWRVTQMYLGIGLQGDTLLTTLFYDVDLVGQGGW